MSIDSENTFKIIKLDDDSVPQDIIDAFQEFDAFCKDNNLFRDNECKSARITIEQAQTQEKVLEKAAKNEF